MTKTQAITMKIAVLIGVIFISYGSVLQVGGQGTSTVTDRYSNEGCDTVRGCFMCADTCNANMAWEPLPNINMVRFNVWGPRSGNTGYVAMGISQNQEMPLSDIYACVVNNGAGELQRYWSPSRSVNRRSPLKGVSNMTVELVDNMIRCDFTRDMFLSDGDAEFYDIGGNNQYHILLASFGSLSGGEITYHTSTRGVTSEPLRLSVVVDNSMTTGVMTTRSDDDSAGTRNMAVMTIHVASSFLALVVTDRLSNVRSLQSFTTLWILVTAVLMSTLYQI